ncbi:MAG TPA: hypothetical protein DCR46_00430 [Cytophagales bacterium]|nr:hypothetical protein [Cytophagales bacterium]
MTNSLTFENPAIETFLYENCIWNAKLPFYDEELKIYKCQLDKIAFIHHVEKPNELTELENSLQNQKKNFIKIKKEIKEEEFEIVLKIHECNAELYTQLQKLHNEIKSKFEQFEKTFFKLLNKLQSFIRIYAER